ncbi:MAG TPA: hypothetical protein VGK43_07610 [Solirubrobacterales bacterium]
MLRIHPAARNHGISDADIDHAVKHAMASEELGDWKRLYLGPGRDGGILEIVTLARKPKPEIVIHAMKMRQKYTRILSGER